MSPFEQSQRVLPCGKERKNVGLRKPGSGRSVKSRPNHDEHKYSDQAQIQHAVIEGLQTVLADSYALMAQTHLAHWNVEGPNFFQLHTAFQKQYEELFGAIDEIAERLRALDVLAIGGLKTLAKGSRIEELAVETTPAKDFVAHLVESNEILLGNAHALRRPLVPQMT